MGGESIRVTLRSGGGDFSFRSSKALQQAAMQWSYIIRNRRRWADDELRRQQATRCQKLMQEFGLTEAKLAEIVMGGTVEVSIPFVSEDVGWEARIFPWEYMLTAAARLVQNETPLVVRHLRRFGERRRTRPIPPFKLLLIESSPSKLKTFYTFDSERALVISSLGFKGPEDPGVQLLVDPTREDLERKVRDFQPNIVHVSGTDIHEGADLGIFKLSVDSDYDGLLLVKPNGELDLVSAHELACLLTAAEHKPALVSFNFWTSAARLCTLAVAYGAGAAIGFQDEFDNSVAENLFSEFYRNLSSGEGGLLGAFQKSWGKLRNQPPSLQGSGVVLWSAHPMVSSYAERERPDVRVSDRIAASYATIETQPKIPLRPSDNTADLRDLLRIEVDPWPRLNYCLLHNGASLFRKFALTKLDERPMSGVQIEVVLHAGSESFPCKITRDLIQGSTDLKDEIQIPLTSTLGRGLRESVQTVLATSITWGDIEVYRDTRRVALLSVDEWSDRRKPGESDDQAWLPSFVLPRDPVVARVVDFAQRYLMVLLDDSTAGFDGYQSADSLALEAVANGEDRTELVDVQVRAIWSALLYDLPLSYVNPPPTYTQSSQRLRTPSDVVNGKRGTCIDLTLLLTACLEYIEIFPVIFLLEGHAFPGYWRDYKSHSDFVKVLGAKQAEVPITSMSALSGGSAGQRKRWLMPRDCYTEILQFVHSGQLVPLETVSLTRRASFWRAIEEGALNLRNKSDFEAMIDMPLARSENVTPLPILGSNGYDYQRS